MVVYTGNDDSLSIDGTPLDDFWRDAELIFLQETHDNSGGRSRFRSRITGLEDVMLNFTIVWDIDQEHIILPRIAPGVHLVDYGPRGNASGCPRHVQEFIFTEVPIRGSYEKGDAREFSITAEAAAPPQINMFENGVFV